MFKFFKLIAYSSLLYLFFAHFTPFIAQFCPNWQTYVDAANEYDIEPGTLYYTDVPVVSDSEHASRRAVIKAYGSMLGWKSVSDESENTIDDNTIDDKIKDDNNIDDKIKDENIGK